MAKDDEQQWALQLQRDLARRTPRPVTDMRAGQIIEAMGHYITRMEEAYAANDTTSVVKAAQKVLRLKAEQAALILAKEAALYGEPRKETIAALMDEYGELVATLEHDIGSPLAPSFA